MLEIAENVTIWISIYKENMYIIIFYWFDDFKTSFTYI